MKLAPMTNGKIGPCEKNNFLCTILAMAKKEQQKTCDICGGSGQLSFSRG